MPSGFAQNKVESFSSNHEEIQHAEVAAQFLKVLLANPRFGTAFDRVREFHLDRGTIGEFENSLCRIAGLPFDEKAAGADPLESVEGVLGPDGAKLPGIASAAGLVVGMLRLQHSESGAAIVALQRAAVQRADDPVARWYFGRALVMAGRTDEAVAVFEQSIARHPSKADFIDICRELARTHQRAQNTAAALAVWQRLENEFPGDLRVKEQIASSLADEGRWQDALTRFEALANETKDAEQRIQANLSASDLLIQLSRPDDAVRLLESQLGNLDADSWLFREIRRLIEGVFRSRDDLVGLTNYYEAWIKAHPEDVDSMGRMARILSLRNQSEAAAEWYSKALKLAPSNVALRESLIEQLVRDKKMTEAIAQYEQLAQYDAGNLDHIENWGQLYLSRIDLTIEERREKAAAVWETLLSDRNDDPSTLARVAGLMRRAELTDRAITLYQLAIEKAPDEPQYREYLGEYLHRLQRADEALATWTAMAEGDRRTRSNLVRLAEVLHSFGVFEPALESMREACSLDPEFGDRLLFAEMLREAAERLAVDDPAESAGRERSSALNGEEDFRPRWGQATEGERTKREELIAESLNQLTLAEGQAETQDEFRQILSERIKTLIVGGQLEVQTKLLAEELQSRKPGLSEAPGVTATEIADRWRTLALYQDAAEKLPEATASALKVVELDPQSAAGWAILADLYERAGRLGDAADAMRKLASLDRRGISDILKKIARLEVRLGRFEQALQAGRDVIKATPGNPEAYQFFADLCFEVGKPDDAMIALRQAVRVNPGDETSLRALAKTLGDQFHTAEAIELYWRAFDKASDLESQTSIVVVLSKLYLRTNQFEKLIQRLDLRARELNLPREMTRHIATAYRESGEFRKAREALERLLIDDTQNVSVLKELFVLARHENSAAAMKYYQQQIADLTSSVNERRLLATLAEESGDHEGSIAIRVSIAETSTDHVETLREIDFLAENQQDDIAFRICERQLQESPDDWEVLFRMARISLRSEGRSEQSNTLFRRILALQLDWSTSSSLAGPRSGLPVVAADWSESPSQFAAWLDQVDDEPMTYGDVFCLSAAELLLGGAADPTIEDLALVFSPQLRSRYGLRVAAFLTVKSQNDRFSKHFWNAIHVFVDDDARPIASVLRFYLINSFNERFEAELPDAQRLLLENLADIIENAPEWIVDSQSNITHMVVSMLDGIEVPLIEMPLHELMEDAVASPVITYGSLMALLRLAVAIEDTTLSRTIMRTINASELPVGALDQEPFVYEITEGALELFESTHEIDGVLDLLSVAWKSRGQSAIAAGDLVSYNFLTRDDITTSLLGIVAAELSSSCLRALTRLDAIDDFRFWAASAAAESTPLEQAVISLFRADIAEMLDDSEQTVFHEVTAAELIPDNVALRFVVAQSAIDFGLVDEAILLMDSTHSVTPAFLIAKEQLILKVATEHSLKDRMRLAAERLFGLPLSTEEQLELISVFSKLGMHDKVAAIEARLGRSSETRQSILGRQLQTYIAQGKNDLAGEAAWELLELASDGSLFSGRRPSDDRDDGGERLQAIKALGRLNRLQPIIDRYEDMLAAAPDSVALLEILAEFHEAAEQWPQLTDKRDRIALLSKKAPPSLKARATELERSGDVSGACDVYLQILASDPESFGAEMETYLQSFERAGRIEDFLKGIVAVGLVHFDDHVETIVSAASLLKKVSSDSPLAKDTVFRLLSGESRHSQTLLPLLLERPEVVSELELLPFVVKITMDDLRDELVFIPGRSMAETKFQRVLESLRQLQRPESLSAVLQPVTEYLREKPDWRAGRIIYVYLQANLGQSELARRIVRDMVADMAIQRDPEFLFDLQNALSLLDGDWTTERIALLQHVLNPQVSPSANVELMDESAKILAALYETTGRTNEARRLVLSEVQRAVQSASSGSRVSEEQVRRVLSAAERIQHSGYPLDAVSLLQSVTAHEVDQFADDLGEDKAIAFKSRFSASDRWARQQITAEKLVEWFAMAVEESASDSAADFSVDLLLELTGTTNSMTREESELKQLGLNSVLLSAIAKDSFDPAVLQERLTGLTAQVLAQEKSDVRLLAVTAAFALRTGNTEQVAVVLERLQETDAVAELLRVQDPVVQDRSLTTPATVVRMRIPEALRSQPAIGLVMLAKLLAGDDSRKSTIESLLIRCAAAAHNSGNRLVRNAVLNECSRTATAANLPELAGRFEHESAAAIKEQIESSSFGSSTKIDIAHEIRTRLLKQP